MTKAQLTTPHRNGLLFLCTGRTGRSQMAEGFARFIGPAEIRYFSAVTEPGAISPHAIKAMREIGIDISAQQPRRLDEIPPDTMATIATIISLCEEDECPALPDGVYHLSWPLPNPVDPHDDDDDTLHAFRRVRDQIRELVSRLF